MKKKIIAVMMLIPVMFMMFILSSCKPEELDPSASPSAAIPSVPAETEKPLPSSTPSAEPSQVPKDAARVEEAVFEKDYELDGANAKVKGELYLSVPVITSEDYPENAAMINEYFANLREKYREGFETELEDAKNDDSYGQTRNPRYLDMSFQTVYNSGNIVSFYISVGSYQGGAHDIIVIDSETFDLSEGVRITADNLFTVDEATYTRRIKDYILLDMDERAKEKDSPFYDNYAELLEQTYDKESFVLTEDGLRVYFQLYDLAPFAGGSFQFEIPYTELEDILNPQYGLY